MILLYSCIFQKPLQRISITHGSYGDGQIAPVIATLKHAPSITDIALNYIDLSDEVSQSSSPFLVSPAISTGLLRAVAFPGQARRTNVAGIVWEPNWESELQLYPSASELADVNASQTG